MSSLGSVLAVPSARPRQRLSIELFRWALLLVTTVLLTYRLVWIGGEGAFPLTIAPLACVLLLLSSVRLRFTRRSIVLLVLVAGYPLLVAVINPIIGGMVEETSQFLKTYALWVANFGIMGLAATLPLRRRLNLAHPAFACLVLLAAVSVVQWVMANLLDMAGDIVMFGSQQYSGAENVLHFTGTGGVRVSGFYYEPSMLGRISMSLAAVCVFSRYRLWESAFLCLVIIAVTLSPGAAVLFAVPFGVVCVASANKQQRMIIGVAVLLILPVAVGFVFWDRIVEIFNPFENPLSGSIRLYLPLFAIGAALVSSPLGGDLGSNAALMRESSVFLFVSEGKITNGVYEFILYTGVVGLTFVAWLLTWSWRSFWNGEWRLGLLILLFLLGPIASSSMLSFEGNFTMIAMILQCRKFLTAKLHEGQVA